jgi:hypothetical protein
VLLDREIQFLEHTRRTTPDRRVSNFNKWRLAHRDSDSTHIAAARQATCCFHLPRLKTATPRMVTSDSETTMAQNTPSGPRDMSVASQ